MFKRGVPRAEGGAMSAQHSGTGAGRKRGRMHEDGGAPVDRKSVV